MSTFKELLGRVSGRFDVPAANSEIGSQDLHDYRARLNPETMKLVVEALEWATWTGGGSDPDQYYCAGCSEHHLDCEKIAHKPTCRIVLAISAINSPNP